MTTQSKAMSGLMSIGKIMISIKHKGFIRTPRNKTTEDYIRGAYLKHGLGLGAHIRGDFYIEIVDEDRVVRISDFSGSKCAGYFPRNTTLLTDLEGNPLRSFNTISTTGWGYYAPPQGLPYKDNYLDFFKTIEDAVKIRVLPNEIPVVGLSSGHDSGAIHCALLNNPAIKFDVVCATGQEDKVVLRARLQKMGFRKATKIEQHTLEDKAKVDKMMSEDLGQPTLGQRQKTPHSHYLLAKSIPNRVLLSGLGADEALYSEDFDLMEDFLSSSAIVYNRFDVDVRYPLLDPLVYKEYKLLEPRLRRRWKQPLEKYLESKDYPVNRGPKVGFYIFDDYPKK